MTTSTAVAGLETNRYAGRSSLQPGQVSQLIVTDVDTADEQLILEIDTLIESPNWSPDGATFVVNGSVNLYRLPVDGSTALHLIPIGAVSGVNNDHVLSPNGERVYFSADGHLYCVDIDIGG